MELMKMIEDVCFQVNIIIEMRQKKHKHTQYEFMPTKLSASNIIHKQFSVNGQSLALLLQLLNILYITAYH